MFRADVGAPHHAWALPLDWATGAGRADDALIGTRYAVLGPDTWLTVHASPGSVSIVPDDALSTLWWTHELLSEVVSDAIEEQAVLRTSDLAKVAGTLVTCDIAAADAIQDLSTLRSVQDPIEKFVAAVGLSSSAGQCATSWAKLTDDVDQIPAWRRVLVSVSDDVDVLARADRFLSHVNLLRKIAPHLPYV